MDTISVVINTRNEAKNIRKAIYSARSVADEIVVVDTGSVDNTLAIAKKLGVKTFVYNEPVSYVEPVRNFSIDKTKGDWILILDADERLTPLLTKKLKTITKDGSCNYVRIPRKNIIFKKWIKHSRWWPDYNIRFFQKGSVTWNEVIHGVPMTTGNGIDLPAKEKYALVHHHYKNINQYLERMIRYTDVEAAHKIKEGYRFLWRDLILKPSDEFFSRFFMSEGYKDGIHGLALALLQAFSELVLYLKLWQNNKFEEKEISIGDFSREFSYIQKNTNYWKADMLYKTYRNFWQKIKRRFKLP